MISNVGVEGSGKILIVGPHVFLGERPMSEKTEKTGNVELA